MADVEIERLTLQVPGLPADQGHRLAELVAAGLDKARFAPRANVGNAPVKVNAPAGTSLDQLASAIVTALRRQMTRGS